MDITYRQQGPEVGQLQDALLELGYSLPKYGADATYGNETVAALEDFIDDHPGHKLLRGGAAPAALVVQVLALAASMGKVDAIPSGVDWHDLTMAHPRLAKKGFRPWKAITGVTLHQAGCWMGNNVGRYVKLRAHIGILRLARPTVVQAYPYTDVVHHGNAFNLGDVGLEFDGLFAGVEGDPNTAWTGGGKYKVGSATESQIVAGRAAVENIAKVVAAHGGELKYIHAHRQTNDTRLSDPGSMVWQEVGVWAQRELGLSDGGDGYTLRDGNPIPHEWDPARTAKYRP